MQRLTLRSTAALAAVALLPLAACAPSAGMAAGPMAMQGDLAAHRFVSAVDMSEIETSMLAQERSADPAVRMFAMAMISAHTNALQAREARMSQLGMGLGLAANAWTPAEGRWTTGPARAGLQPGAAPARHANMTWAGATMRHEMALTPAGAAMLRTSLDGQAPSRPVMAMAMRTMERLEDLQGARFDAAYIEAQVMAHREALQGLDRLIASGSVGPEVLGMLEATRASVAGHLEMAQAIQARL